MSESSDRLGRLRREYEAGRITADTYINAGGDPDVVRQVAADRAKKPPMLVVIRWLMYAVATYLIITAIVVFGMGGSGVAGPLFYFVVGVVLALVGWRIVPSTK